MDKNRTADPHIDPESAPLALLKKPLANNKKSSPSSAALLPRRALHFYPAVSTG
jgi:hypothetical protein